MALKLYQSKIIIWLLVALPGLCALAWVTPADFSTPGAILNMLGRLTGIWGLACLLVAAILCCRVPGFDQPFGGLTRLWKLHHRIGGSGFLLLLAHPLLLALAAAEVSIDAAIYTLFSSQWPVLWGWVALLVLMLVMAPTFHVLGEPNYQRWKQMHRLAAISVVFALMHSLMLGRSLPGISGEVIWIFFMVMALSAMGYRWLISRYCCRYPYQVSKIKHLSEATVELSLQPLKNQLHYRAGQFVYLTPDAPELSAGNGEEHPYTLSSAPSEPGLRIAIKSLGDASRALQNIAVGSQVTIEGPYGRFFPATAPQTNSLWIAGGIGIVPFLSYLRHCTGQNEHLNIKLIYCVQDEAHLMFGDELRQLASTLQGCHFIPHFFYRDGPLDAKFIEQHCPDFSSRQLWICGPAPLIARSRQIVPRAGVASSDIITEEFTLL